MTLHCKLWYTMVCLFQNNMVFYHGFPVSKHHGILPWLPCFKTTWYFTMASLFQNNMVFYHGFPVSKHHGLEWYTMIFYHGLPVSKQHGILPWFTCFKTTWYFTMVYLFQHTMVYHGIYHGIFIRELPNSMGRGHLVLLT